jgi:hypothetical protein
MMLQTEGNCLSLEELKISDKLISHNESFRWQIIQGMLSECIIIRNDISHGAAVTRIIALDKSCRR